MRIGRCTAINFCSYSLLNFDYSDLGLACVSGSTASGKSTLMDLPAWVLFGTTGKAGNAEDIRSWGVDDTTEGEATVEIAGTVLTVTRHRAPGKNDLFWTEGARTGKGPECRGKDLNDTQRLLNVRLGVDLELFLLSSYLTQFSDSDKFFIAKAKDRRDVLEQIADQQFPITLGEKASEARKDAKKKAQELELEISSLTGKIKATEALIAQTKVRIGTWNADQEKKVNDIKSKMDNFEAWNAARLAAASKELTATQSTSIDLSEVKEAIATVSGEITNLTEKEKENYRLTQEAKQAVLKRSELTQTECPTCGAKVKKINQAKIAELDAFISVFKAKVEENNAALKEYPAKRSQIERLNAMLTDQMRNKDRIVSLQEKCIMIETAQNPHVDQYKAAKAEQNPHVRSLEDAEKAGLDAVTSLTKRELEAEHMQDKVSKLTWLYAKSFEMRSLLMARVVDQVQDSTNFYLETYFDAPIRVKFLLEDSDKLEVEITNNGYLCGFRSLSGGERTQLKLCFSLSLMRAAQDKAGISFGQLFLDEPLGGLDDGAKIKAFRLLEALSEEYGTVLCIDHTEAFQGQFHKQYAVEKTDGHSTIRE